MDTVYSDTTMLSTIEKFSNIVSLRAKITFPVCPHASLLSSLSGKDAPGHKS